MVLLVQIQYNKSVADLAQLLSPVYISSLERQNYYQWLNLLPE